MKFMIQMSRASHLSDDYVGRSLIRARLYSFRLSQIKSASTLTLDDDVAVGSHNRFLAKRPFSSEAYAVSDGAATEMDKKWLAWSRKIFLRLRR